MWQVSLQIHCLWITDQHSVFGLDHYLPGENKTEVLVLIMLDCGPLMPLWRTIAGFGSLSRMWDTFNILFRIKLSLLQIDKMVTNKRKVCKNEWAALFLLFADMCSPIWKKATCQYKAGIPRYLWKMLCPESESEDWGWHGWRRLEFLRWPIARPWKIWFLPARSSCYFY